jgi:tRNA G10  N-methylase Trm11
MKLQDRISVIYTDTPYGFNENFEIISKYADKLRQAASKALEEEAILVVVYSIYHSI